MINECWELAYCALHMCYRSYFTLLFRIVFLLPLVYLINFIKLDYKLLIVTGTMVHHFTGAANEETSGHAVVFLTTTWHIVICSWLSILLQHICY
jgi:hypothetical protein